MGRFNEFLICTFFLHGVSATLGDLLTFLNSSSRLIAFG